MRGDEFGQIVEYVTEAGVFSVAPEMFDLSAASTLEAVKADYAKVAALGRAKTLDVNAIKAQAAEVYHQDVIENEITSTDPVEVFDRLHWVKTRPEWRAGITVVADEVYFRSGNLYRCVQGHNTQADWAPDAPGMGALWTRYYVEEWPTWVQPAGAHDAYRLNAKVTHNGRRWINTGSDANVWAPGVFGWTDQGPA